MLGSASEINRSFSECSLNTNISTISGGLVGQLLGTIQDSYSNCRIGPDFGGFKGGLIGQPASLPTFFPKPKILRSYAIGPISCISFLSFECGGLVGIANSNAELEIINSYWNMETTGMTHSVGSTAPTNFAETIGGTGLTSTQMRNSTNFLNWDFNTIWKIEPDSFRSKVIGSRTKIRVTTFRRTKN